MMVIADRATYLQGCDSNRTNHFEFRNAAILGLNNGRSMYLLNQYVAPFIQLKIQELIWELM